MNVSEINLYQFYRLIGNSSCASLIEGHDFYVVSGNGRSWPQMIFDIRFEENAGLQLARVFSDASEIINVDYAVCNRIIFNIQDQVLLRKNKLYPLETWQLMEINPKNYWEIRQQNEFEIKKIMHNDDISAFTSLVNSDLMSNQKINAELLQELANHSDIELYGLYVNNQLVTGLLSFSGLNKVTGLYFIVTKNEHRGQGLASKLISSVINLLFQQEVTKVVLQALPKAVNLYTRMGFSENGKLVTFWKQ